MAKVLMVSHGLPPREAAGTEQHTLALALALQGLGVEVALLAATRAPGEAHGALLHGQLPGAPGAKFGPLQVIRLVNNVPVRRLADAEADPSLAQPLARAVRALRPDLVHVHHLQFIGSGLMDALPAGLPTVMTLHDRWMWCAAGGLGQLPSGARCPGPAPDRCAPCAAAWAPTPGRRARALLGAAGVFGRILPVDRLHRLYQTLPDGLRAPLRRGRGAPEGEAAAKHRNDVMMGVLRGFGARISPSAHLAAEAEALGSGPVRVIPHGVELPPGPQPARRKGLIFLGSLSHHKGPDLVVAAWSLAFPAGDPPLRLHGPPGDLRLPPGLVGPPLDRAGVAAALRGAEALVLGSRWQENAPLVILEARAAGCPVVAPRAGGVPELLQEGVDGLLYPPGDVEALAAALRQVVAAPPGPPRPPPRPDAQAEAVRAVYAALLA